MISGEISRFPDPFQISADFMVVRVRPIARERSVAPVSVRPSGTQRVPECVCVKYSIYGHVLLDEAARGAVTAVVSQGSRIFPAFNFSFLESFRGEQTSLKSYKDVKMNTFTKEF